MSEMGGAHEGWATKLSTKEEEEVDMETASWWPLKAPPSTSAHQSVSIRVYIDPYEYIDFIL